MYTTRSVELPCSVSLPKTQSISNRGNGITRMVRVGLVGVGFMGWIHQLAYRRSTTATLAAFCSSDPKKRLGDWRGIRGNFGPPGEQISLDGIEVFESMEQMVRSPDIDVIDICLPPHAWILTCHRTLRC